VVSAEHQAAANRFKRLYSAYQQNQDLISVGAYQTGTNAEVDEAILYYPRLMQFLRQDSSVAVSFEQSLQGMLQTVGGDLNLLEPGGAAP
ncbi:MAG: hypothetical protein WBP02_01695, partial [Gammaproteobacteria bacterium]